MRTPPALRRWEWALLALVLAYGVLLRGCRMGDIPLWVDEAETSINALSILEHGVPRDHYLGLPIYENTFTEPSPDSREYEFRDTSYSPKGLAIYHGWLPLYAVAASFSWNGIRPDQDGSTLRPRYSLEEVRRRTRAARLPAVVFGTIFMIAMFLTARYLYGADAGWAALTAATIASSAIVFARQARYYSSTLAISTLCCLCLWLIVKRGRWQDFSAGGVLFVLLFHTNMLAFLTVCGAAICALPLIRFHARAGGKLAVFATIVAAGTIPWIAYTGFLDVATDRPMARTMLSLEDVLQYPRERLAYVVLVAATLGWLAVARKLRGRIPDRFIDPFARNRPAFLLTGVWAVCAFFSFVWLVPAASYFSSRLTLVLLVPLRSLDHFNQRTTSLCVTAAFKGVEPQWPPESPDLVFSLGLHHGRRRRRPAQGARHVFHRPLGFGSLGELPPATHGCGSHRGR